MVLPNNLFAWSIPLFLWLELLNKSIALTSSVGNRWSKQQSTAVAESLRSFGSGSSLKR